MGLIGKAVDMDKKKSEPDKYEIEEWCRTMERAAEIMKDPKKMRYVSQHLEQKQEALKTFAGFAAKKAKD